MKAVSLRSVALSVGAGLALGLFAPALRADIGESPSVRFAAVPGAFVLVQGNDATPIVVAANDWPGVQRAAGDLRADVERVSGLSPRLGHALPELADDIVVIGTVGRSALIDRLVAERKLDVSAIRGAWESWIMQMIDHPFPGIGRALVIAGSDKRGSIYGAYDLSEQMGVSPWSWWADVPPRRHGAIFVEAGPFVHGPPAVKYRGIFLNDEAPDLTNWVRAKFGTVPARTNPPVPAGVANYGRDFYARVFELILRLRGNYLWPAMWNNAFNEDDPLDARQADQFGIVMGTSHQEPMLRAQKEWDRRYLATAGPWNYATNRRLLSDFWREGVRRNRGFESIVTLGLRGANDTPMALGGPEANLSLLERIVADQRSLLRQEMNPDLRQVPQMWCLYKEVQDYYEAGMQVPDDVTLLWADDNWGNLRRVPTSAERLRSGGAGIYYHFDYHGGPRSYQWINSNPIPKIWEQLSVAARSGADRIWIVNVGHLKGYELPTEFFFNLAWNSQRWTGDTLGDFTRLWAEREFGPAHAAEIAEILDLYSKYNGRRKPELLAPDTYSLVNYDEAQTVVDDFNRVAERAQKIGQALPRDERDAFYELVEFPATASALVNEIYLEAGKNALFAQQGRASANEHAIQARRLYGRFLDLIADYNGAFAEGKWAHFMDQPVFGYTGWRDPPANTLAAVKLVTMKPPERPSLGVSVDGSPSAWPGPAAGPALSEFDAISRGTRHFEIFNRGTAAFSFSAAASEPWIKLDRTVGTVGADARIGVTIDWDRAPAGLTRGVITVTGAGDHVSIAVAALRPSDLAPESVRGFVAGQGFVSIEPEHFDRNLGAGASRWSRIAGYGRTLSGMRAEGPGDAAGATPGKDAPCLEYPLFLFREGTAQVTVITGPTLNFVPDRGLRLAVSFDDEAPQLITLIPQGYQAQNGNRSWEQSVMDNAHQGHSTHTLARGGEHTLKVWMVDPDVVLQKIVVDLGGLKESYLGPPESVRAGPIDSSPGGL